MVSAGAAKSVTTGAADPKNAWMTETQREAHVDYRGIQKTDDQLTKAFRDKLA